MIGLPEEGREHMEAFGHMVWSTLGPPNELFEEAMADVETLGGWIGSATLRENLAPDSLGMAMFEAADAGAITDDDALLLVQTIVAASADTTVMTLSAAIRAFCEFPEQWQALRAYCARKCIRMVGDIAIFVNFDSADVWTHPELFRLNAELDPEVIAGVPPDFFRNRARMMAFT